MKIHVLAPALALLLVLSACNSDPEEAPPAPVSRNPIPGLLGEIEIARDVIQVGETLEVAFYIRNKGRVALTADLCDSCPEPGRPWRDFRFDSRHVGAPDEKLELVPPGPEPRTGPIQVPPGERLEFARATFQAPSPGRYVLSGIIEWTGVDIIEFESVPVLVLAGREGEPGSAETAEVGSWIGKLADPAAAREAKAWLLEHPERSIGPLLEVLGDPDERLRNEAREVLLLIGKPVVPAARRLIEDRGSRPEARSVAAYIVAELGGPEGISFLAGVARNDPDPTVRRMALAILHRGKGVHPDLAIDTYIAALGDPDPAVRALALEYLQLETRQDLGGDPARWRTWWEERKRGG